MLTNEKIAQLNKKLNEKQELCKQKYDEKEDVINFIANDINLWMSKLVGEDVKVRFEYDYDYNFDVTPYEKTPYASIAVTSINGIEASFEHVKITVKKHDIKYSMWSGDFTKEDVARMTVIRLISALQLNENEDKLRELSMSMLNKYELISSDYYLARYEVKQINKMLEENEKEIKLQEASNNLKEGCVYVDGAAKGWYLKVMKITNKLVKCRAYKDYRNYHNTDSKYYGLNYMHDRQIKKDDFLTCLVSGYYKVMEEDVKVIDPSSLK